MPPTHVLSVPAPRGAPFPAPFPAPVRRAFRAGAPLPSLTRRAAPSVGGGLLLAFIVLALLLQASFLVGLAAGEVGGPDAVRAPSRERAAVVR